MKQLLAAALLCAALTGLAAAQTANATLGGTVSDSSGALIPGVTVVATNADTGVSSSVITNESGVYSFPTLQPGANYSVSAQLPGFQTQNYTRVQLAASQPVRLNFTLSVAGVASEIEVSIPVDQLIATSSSSVGQVIPDYKVRDLPLVGRDVLDLIAVMPGVQGEGGNANFAGLGAGTVNTTRDGISVNDGRYNNGVYSATRINPDLVGEVRIILAPVDAETGRGSGQVQIQTKSGTNQYHGSAVWNVQNSALNANTWNNNRTGAQANWSNKHQVTASVGGPIVRNKTFFFFLYDGQRQRSRTTVNAVVLTDQARQGIFRYFPGVTNGNADSGFGTGANPTQPVVNVLGNPVRPPAATGDLVEKSVFGFDPNRPSTDPSGFISRLLEKMPRPNFFGNAGGTPDGLNTAVFRWQRATKGTDSFAGTSDDTNRDQTNIKIDHNISQRHKLSVNWTWEHDFSAQQQSPWPDGYDGEVQRYPQVITSSFTSSLSSSLVNEARFGLRRGKTEALEAFDHSTTGAEALTWLPVYNGTPVMMHLSVSGLGSHMVNCNIGCGSLGNTTPLWTYADTLNWTKGKHAFKGGGEVRLSRTNGWNSDQIVPHATFGGGSGQPAFPTNAPYWPGTLTTGNQTMMRNLLTTLAGNVQQIDQAFSMSSPTDTEFKDYRELYRKYRDFHQNEFALFFKDDWKLNKDLTLNLGLRYEYFGVPFISNGLTAAPVGGGAALFGWSGRGFETWKSPSLAPRADLTTVEFVGPNSPNPDRSIYPDDWNNFGPAVGFSWSIPWFGEGKTVMRGGYQMSYTGGGQGLSLDTDVGSAPGINDAQVFNPNVYTNLTNLPIPVPKNKPLAPIPVTERTKTISAWDPNFVTPYIQNFTLSVQRQLRRNVSVDLTYIGTKGTKLTGTIPINDVNFVNNGLLEAFILTRQGGDAELFDRMLQGLAINGAAQPAVGTNGVTGSAALRANTTFDNLLADGNIGTFSSTLNNSVLGSPAGSQSFRGSLIRRAGLPENFITANPQFSTVNYRTNPAGSTYHSMQAQVTLRPTQGISYQGTYVWSKAISSGVGPDATNRQLGKGLQASHRTHDFRSTGSFELPVGPNKLLFSNSTGLVARLIERWQMSWIMNISSGQPLGIAATNSHTTATRPDIVGNFPKDLGRARMTDGLPVYFDPGQFTFVPDPAISQVTTREGLNAQFGLNALADANGNILLRNAAPGTIGNMASTWIEGPGSFRFDLSASKSVNISESKSLQLRVDARNVLNHPTIGNPTLNINQTNTFGQVAGANVTGSRQFQGQLRFTF